MSIEHNTIKIHDRLVEIVKYNYPSFQGNSILPKIVEGCCGFNCHNYFVLYFHQIPHEISFYKLDINLFVHAFTDAFKDEIIDFIDSRIEHFKEGDYHNRVTIVCRCQMIIDIDYTARKVDLIHKVNDPEYLNRFMDIVKLYPNQNTNRYIHLLYRSHEQIETIQMPIKKSTIDLSKHYNDDFLPIHNKIVDRLNLENDKGLVLLYGKPGTGKTSYLRHLITQLDKKVIFLTSTMTEMLTEPHFISVLLENPNTIFVIEDAENIILSREHNNSSAVSNILNITDGLLSDCLNVQMICTFNTDITKIDSALLRKGRLIAYYEFNALSLDKTQTLAQEIGMADIPVKGMTLAELFNNQDQEVEFEKKRVKIGF